MSSYPPPMPPRRSVAGTTLKVLAVLLGLGIGALAFFLLVIVGIYQLT